MVQYMSPALRMAFVNCRRRQTLVGYDEIGFIAARIEFDGHQRIHIVRQRANPREHKLARTVDLHIGAGTHSRRSSKMPRSAAPIPSERPPLYFLVEHRTQNRYPLLGPMLSLRRPAR